MRLLWIGPLAVATALTVGCQRLAAPPCPRGARALAPADRPTSYAQRDVFLRYFPAAFVAEAPDELGAKLSDFSASWYTGKLLDFEEPSLSERGLDTSVEAYRVLQMPSLSVLGDFTIRVERRAGSVWLESKRSEPCEDARGEGLMTGSARRGIGESTWSSIAACMERAFWSAPVRDSVMGEDGWTTVFEGVRDGRYHVVERWALHDEERVLDRRALADCRRLLLEAAGWSERVVPER